MYFRYFIIISPWKRAGALFEPTWIPFIKGCFVLSLIEIGPVILEKKMKWWEWWKAYRHTCIDGHMVDDGQQAIRKAQFSFQLRWGKMFTRIQKGGQRENRQYLIGKIHLSSSEIKVKKKIIFFPINKDSGFEKKISFLK